MFAIRVGTEIDPWLRSQYFRQVQDGLEIRQLALLTGELFGEGWQDWGGSGESPADDSGHEVRGDAVLATAN